MTATGARAGLLRVLALASLVTTVVLCVLTGWGDVPWWGLPALAAGVAITEIAIVHLRFGRQRWSLSLTEAVVGGTLVVAAGGWMVLGVVAGSLLALAVRRQTGLKLLFNVAQLAVATAAAQAVATQFDGERTYAGAACGLVAFWVLNHSLVAVAVALSSGRRLLPLVVFRAPLSLLHTAGNASIGLLAVFLVLEAPFGLFGLVVPLVLLWVSYDREARSGDEARLYRELADGQEQAVTRSTDVSAQVIMTAAARIFGGADVEMVLLAADGPVRWVGDEDGVPRRTRVEPDAFDAPWILRALGGRPVATGTSQEHHYCTMVLGPADSPQAVLAARRDKDAGAFGRRELGLAEVLRHQAEQWLSVSALSARYEQAAEQAAAASGATRVLGDIGAATAPSLTVLRDSAGRLSRLADYGGGVDDIVEELHLVERAVASLLGAVALAAESELITGAGDADNEPALGLPQRSATDWTTTGVLR